MSVVVLQSHTSPLPALWYEDCVSSVRDWAASRGFDYQWLDDELFDVLSEELREKTRAQPVIGTDLARLKVLARQLTDHDRAIWLDADVLVLAPEALQLSDAEALFGREVWIQWDDGRLRSYRKIHNAFMAFTRGNPVLPFYEFAAERILHRHSGPMVPQLIGPKLLTLLHNALGFDVLESAGMLSPAVSRDLLAGGGEALQRFQSESDVQPAAVNLCGSAVARGELTDGDLRQLVELLLGDPSALGG